MRIYSIIVVLLTFPFIRSRSSIAITVAIPEEGRSSAATLEESSNEEAAARKIAGPKFAIRDAPFDEGVVTAVEGLSPTRKLLTPDPVRYTGIRVTTYICLQKLPFLSSKKCLAASMKNMLVNVWLQGCRNGFFGQKRLKLGFFLKLLNLITQERRT